MKASLSLFFFNLLNFKFNLNWVFLQYFYKNQAYQKLESFLINQYLYLFLAIFLYFQNFIYQWTLIWDKLNIFYFYLFCLPNAKQIQNNVQFHKVLFFQLKQSHQEIRLQHSIKAHNYFNLNQNSYSFQATQLLNCMP